MVVVDDDIIIINIIMLELVLPGGKHILGLLHPLEVTDDII